MLVNGNFPNHDYKGNGYTGCYQLQPKRMGDLVNKHVHNRIPENKKKWKIQGASLSAPLFLDCFFHFVPKIFPFGYYFGYEKLLPICHKFQIKKMALCRTAFWEAAG